jgi:two-component system, NtrC family, C4-dicarboxylate transport sensor histidine kinase DctB
MDDHPEMLPETTRLAGWPGWISKAMLAVAAALIIVAVLLAAGDYGRQRGYQLVADRARSTAELNAVLLRTVLEKQRSVPFVLSQDRDVINALSTRSESVLQRLNRKLENLIGGTGSAVIYLLDADGLAIAASNWNEPVSFVGTNYSFRPYYTRAIRNGSAEHYALGTVSRQPGLYISKRIDGPTGLLGVIVVKLVFDEIEADWRRNSDPTLVVDQRGIVLVTSFPDWRFMTEGVIPADRMGPLRESLQFGGAPLAPLDISPAAPDGGPDIVRSWLPGATRQREFVRVQTQIPTTNWKLQSLTPTAPTVTGSARTAQLVAILILAPVLGLTAFFLRRRGLVLRRAREQEMARVELERRVAARTADLSAAHAELVMEAEERQKTEAKLQTVQLELVQANRLAILGQVTAGVAHEINQPVAAIRSYADNAATFLARNQAGPARDNLTVIAELTERIGSITDELRAFSRKGTSDSGPVSVNDIIEGALLLLGSRFRQRAGQILTETPPPEVQVYGNRIRLEQVLINLMQNALEATEGGAASRISVRYKIDEDELLLIVSDNGPGIPDSIMQMLFTPFNTSKDRGLGLGLVICHDIVAEYGGRIGVVSTSDGAEFTVHLKRVI